MTGGLAGVSGTILGAYISFGVRQQRQGGEGGGEEVKRTLGLMLNIKDISSLFQTVDEVMVINKQK